MLGIGLGSLLVCLTFGSLAYGKEAVFFQMEKVAEEHLPSCGGFAWCNTSMPLEQRVDLLVKELTPEEKILQLSNDLFGGVPAIERVGLQSYNYIREAAHGVLLRGGRPQATSFPQVVAMAASFNRSLFRRVGRAVGREARYLQDVGVMWGDYLGRYGGLVLQFNVNLFRDPRWGRGQETPGESPELTGAFAEAYVRGIQTPLPGKTTPQAAASCKHYAAYSFEGGPTELNRTTSMRHTVPGYSNVSRHNEDAVVSRRDFLESYDEPWVSCVKAKALGVMCAYNQVNGVPSCGNQRLLRKLLREKWGFEGVVVTDCDSISDMYALQKYRSTPSATIRAALAAGTDVSCSPGRERFGGGGSFSGLAELRRRVSSAVCRGFFKQHAHPSMDGLLTQAVKDALGVRFRLGEQRG
ncbi:Beta-D-xylosidase 3 (AtBXL3) (Alpha-L-arabinofuranosidase) [Durusdinium trenchii]|uniref:Beta-D-xylosidase 3 (AtBXL3) (Alpha-L-arabinofuranosidase) n=1 Tax=Durusdinium trenchii TaxID=1381693 RepID=A0ABP0L654_9DINO